MIAHLRQQAFEVATEIGYFRNRCYPGFVMEDRSPVLTDQVPVFTYHGVGPRSFKDEMKYLADNGYHSLTITELVHFMDTGMGQDGKGIVITFDDGLETVWTLGGPVLKEYGFCAAAFIIPDRMGHPGYLSWEQVRRMHESKIFDIQSHSLTHRTMSIQSGCTESDMGRELEKSKQVIEKHLPGHCVRDFCYPKGLGCEEAVRISREAGYRTNFWCVRTDRALNRQGDSPYHIVRLKHDYIFRLPGKGRKGLAPIMMGKLVRRVKQKAFVE